MQVTTKALILSAIKYSDTSLIVKAFTASNGIKTYMLRGILHAKKGKLKAAYFQPLSQLEIVATHKNKGTLEHLKEAKVYYHYQSLHTHFSKNAIALFLAELLANCIHEEEQNQGLFHFIEASLQWLDIHKEVANFHPFFMLSLTKYLGFFPDVNNAHKNYFDLLEGDFTDVENLNPMIRGKNLYYFKAFLGINFDTLDSVKMNKASRQELLQSLILYFELHLQGFRKPKSLAVLNEVFGSYA